MAAILDQHVDPLLDVAKGRVPCGSGALYSENRVTRAADSVTVFADARGARDAGK